MTEPSATQAPATAAVLIIGDEILSGRTADTNLNVIARFLVPLGVDLKEARVVADDTADIVAAVNALRGRYDYVFTTGGIGPTHDDITADAIASAFGVELHEHPEIIALLRSRPGLELNAARRRMARVPEGGSLIDNPGGPPGFQIANVFVLAGVPGIMCAMLEDIPRRLRTSVAVVSRTLRVDGSGEGLLAAPLEAVAKAHPTLSLGSYPFSSADGYGANLVVRGRDRSAVDAASDALTAALRAVGVAAVEAN